jgi:hypothetical protein
MHSYAAVGHILYTKPGVLLPLQTMAEHVGLKEGAVTVVGVEYDVHEVLWLANAVVYRSIWEELSFPPILIRAMSLERPVVVPNIDAIGQKVRSPS